MSKKKIAVIGGGNGSAIVLGGLKNYADKFDISAVISMSDSGGSSGRLRKELKTLPPGDIMRAVLSLSSKYDFSMLRKIFYSPRFKGLGKKLEGHNLGNLFLVLTAKYSGDFLKALEALSQSVESAGKVFPASLQAVHLAAELSNGKIVKTECLIDAPNYDRSLKIKHAWLEPDCRAYVKAVQAIKSADYVILSPGSLYTSIIAALLPAGIKTAIKASKGRIVYIEGAYRTNGETGPECFSGLIAELEKYLPRKIDLILHDNTKLNTTQRKFFKEKKWANFEFDKDGIPDRKIKIADFRTEEGGLSSVKLGKIFKNILV